MAASGSYEQPDLLNTEPRERLDQYNGLLLLPNLDKAFDLGFITFSRAGEIIVSAELDNAEALGVEKTMHLDLTDQHQPYMAFRERVFEKLVWDELGIKCDQSRVAWL